MTDQNVDSNCRQTIVRRRRAYRICSSILFVGLVLYCASGVHAQPPQPPAPAPVVSVSRSWYLEAVIVVGMCGLALFVVCRSSRRN
jgi:hypothetical protein